MSIEEEITYWREQSLVCWSCGAISTPEKRRLMFISPTECYECANGISLSSEQHARLLERLGRPFIAFECAPEGEPQ